MHRTLSIAAILILPLTASAAGPESLSRLGTAGFGAARAVPVAAFQAGRPRLANVHGSYGGAPVSLELSRTEWTLKGTAGGAPVDLKIDHDAKTISGKSGGRDVSLSFDWTPERVTVSGTGVSYTVDFGKVSLEGEFGGRSVQLGYEAGWFRGRAFERDSWIAYDRVSGAFRGWLGPKPVELQVVNMEIGEFLQYFFLFAD